MSAAQHLFLAALTELMSPDATLVAPPSHAGTLAVAMEILDSLRRMLYFLCTTKEVHMPESTFTLRVDDHLKDAFTEAARVNDRTGAQLIRDFMREYVQSAREKAEYESWFRRKVEAGIEAIQEGRVLSSAEVEERAKARRERLLSMKGVRP